MSKGLVLKVENLFAALLRLTPALKGVRIRRQDQDVKATSNTVVITATVGDRMLDGFRGHLVDVECEWRSSTTESSVNDAVEQAIRDGIQNARPGCTRELDGFSDLNIEPDMETSRDHSKNQRKRAVRFNVMAKEKA